MAQETELVELDYESGTLNNAAQSICVVGDTIYIAGWYQNGTVPRACYWVNGKKYDLEVDDTSSSSYAYSIKVINGIIFTVGIDNAKACFWLNQNKSYMGDKVIQESNDIFINQISSSIHEIYIGGMNMIDEACYWKDGEIYDLSCKNKDLEKYILSLLDYLNLEYYRPDCKPKLREKQL